MVKSETTLPQIDFACYQDSLVETESMIKKVKAQEIGQQPQMQEEFVEQTVKVVTFMSQPAAYKLSNYTRSMLLLDNILVIHKDILSSIRVPSQFMLNLCSFFISISKMQGREDCAERVESLIYGCLYLILLLIYKAGNNLDTKTRLMIKVLNDEFIEAFTNLNFEKPSDKMSRVMAMILTYIVRNKSISHHKKSIKGMVLDLVSNCEQEVTKAYLAVVLKKVFIWVKSCEIQKYNVLEFLFSCMRNRQGQTVKNSLIIVEHIVKNFKQYTQKIIKMGLMKIWDANIKTQSQICLKIFKEILAFIPQDKKQNWFDIYLSYAFSNSSNISHVHISILQNLVHSVSLKFYIQKLESGFLEKISSIQRSNNQKLNETISSLKKTFIHRMQQLDMNLFLIYQNFESRNLEKNLLPLY